MIIIHAYTYNVPVYLMHVLTILQCFIVNLAFEFTDSVSLVWPCSFPLHSHVTTDWVVLVLLVGEMNATHDVVCACVGAWQGVVCQTQSSPYIISHMYKEHCLN